MPPRIQAVAGSSNIAGTGYDPDTKELAVRFHSGRTYTFDGVDADVYDSFLNAPSLGKYFNAHIKDRYQSK